MFLDNESREADHLQGSGSRIFYKLKTSALASDPRTIVLFGIPFHDLTMSETLDWIDRLIAKRRPAYLVTANLDFAAQASEDVELQRILVEAELVLCDGTPLVWASRLTGKPLRERVAGSDLVPCLAAHAEKMGYRIFLLGGEISSLEGAAKNLQSRYPALPPVRFFSPPFAPLHEFDNQEIIQEIQKEKPDILLVAFGCPKQEKWIYMHYRKLGVPCCIGVGATIDFLAGKVSRAPAWVAKTGLEWIYRMLQEPKRLAGRYLKDLFFLLRQSFRESRAIASGGSHAVPNSQKYPEPAADGLEIITWHGALTAGHVEEFPMPTLDKSFVIDLSRVTKVDSRGLGVMLRLIRRAWAGEVAGCFFAPSQAVRSVVEVTRLDRILPLSATMAEARLLIEKDAATVRLRPVAGDGSGVLLFTMPSRVSADVAESFSQAVRNEWEERSSANELALDFGETHFIDSSGLGFLIRCHRMVTQREGSTLRLVNLRDNVLNVIKVAKLQGMLLAEPPK
jgi:N-acetylglucosaminyldiphosphoundecaprenol N-acetyl-beta-D-mannosaminyltransferase